VFVVPARRDLLYYIVIAGFAAGFIIPVMGHCRARTYEYQSRREDYDLFNFRLHGVSPFFCLGF